MPMSPRTERSARWFRWYVTITSIFFGVTMAAFIVVHGSYEYPNTSTVFNVCMFIIIAVFGAWGWQAFSGSFFRKQFRLDRDYHPIDDDR
jgi:hypothetical protein